MTTIPFYFAETAAPFQNMNPKQSSTALLEIIVMLLGAFLLGYLLHWLICRARHDTTATTTRRYADTETRVARDEQTSASTYNSRRARQGSSRDDLTVIEGIGRRANELLHDNGITNYAELADTPTRKLQSILDEGGRNFNSLDPKTWARQARLARDGKMDELETLKEELTNGR